jgi:hypothetical protein
MTLKEKFKERLYNQSHDDSECLRIKFENIDKFIDSQEVTADEFAIEFAEWLIEKEREHPNRIIRGKKLLERYKKEKGL